MTMFAVAHDTDEGGTDWHLIIAINESLAEEALRQFLGDPTAKVEACDPEDIVGSQYDGHAVLNPA